MHGFPEMSLIEMSLWIAWGASRVLDPVVERILGIYHSPHSAIHLHNVDHQRRGLRYSGSMCYTTICIGLFVGMAIILCHLTRNEKNF